jgi:hypothetical protein
MKRVASRLRRVCALSRQMLSGSHPGLLLVPFRKCHQFDTVCFMYILWLLHLGRIVNDEPYRRFSSDICWQYHHRRFTRQVIDNVHGFCKMAKQ